MDLKSIEKRSGVTREIFKAEYLEPRKPLIFTDLVADWPATQKWSFDYLADNYGDILVPVVDDSFREPGKKYLSTSPKKMVFREFLSRIQEGPTDLRIFLYNIMAEVPELANDIQFLDIMDGFVKKIPFMFFGGQGSTVGNHYDLDCAHVFLTHFQTRKRIVLFDPGQSRALYQHPFTVQSHVNIDAPDFDKFPAARALNGFECILNHGETLFIPSQYWHYVEYIDPGFGLAMRAFKTPVDRVQGMLSAAKNYSVDKGMNFLLGKRWKTMKENIAERRAHQVVNSQKQPA